MVDTVSRHVRSQIMRRIKSADTGPERKLRSALHKMDARFRLHDHGLPGRPDIVFRRAKVAVQVRGCFWHMHECGRRSLPKTRPKYWETKLRRNKVRDKEKDRELKSLGWRVIVVWECELIHASGVHASAQNIASVVGRRIKRASNC